MIPSSLLAAIRFLTRLPVPGPDTTAEDLKFAVVWFPLIGALLGLLVGGFHALCVGWWPAWIAAVLTVGFGLMVTGGFHEDAATDAADGLGGGWTTDDVQRIMKDSRIGAYGAMGLWCLLTFRAAALVALGSAAWLPLAAAWCWGRWSAAPLLRGLPALSSTGLSRDIGADLPTGAVRITTVLALLITGVLLVLGMMTQDSTPWRLLLAPGAALVACVLWWAYLAKRVGGQSGDLLGAGNQLVECAVLLVFLATFVPATK